MRPLSHTALRRVLLVLAAVAAGPAQAHADTFQVAPGRSGSACTAVAPCGSLEAAYRAAAPGDVVQIAGGSYPKQTIPALGRPAPAVEIAAVPGATVQFSGLDVKADNVIVRGVHTSFADVEGSASDFVDNVRFFDVHARTHWVSAARDFTWTRGSIGPNHNKTPHVIGGTPTSYRLVYDQILWHDATRDASDVHIECLLALGPQGLTIRNSRFTNCAVFDILISRILSDPPPRDFVIENTVLEASKDVDGSNGYYTLMTGEDLFDGFTLRNNVWGLAISLPGPLRDARIVGNVGQAASCRSGVTYSHNVFGDRKCSSSDRVANGAFAAQFVDPDRGDWRLKPGAAAIDAADPGDHPATDAAGCPRPVGAGPDAGAYEFGSPSACAATGGGPPPSGDPSDGGAGIVRRRARVLGVIDGETLRVRLVSGGRRLKVRLAGVNAPPRRGRSSAARCGARKATSSLRRLTMGKRRGRRVTVVSVGRLARDARGRVPASISLKGSDVGRRLIASGRARVSAATVLSHQRAAYETAQRSARDARLGVWRHCAR